jgi:hypothetical protein
LNTWRAVGYIFLGIGSVFLIIAFFIFLSMMSMFSQIPYAPQGFTLIALITVTPYLILASITYVIGGICYYVGRERVATPIASIEANVTTRALLEKIERLEGIVDNNFNVITKRLNEIEEKQNLVAQNTIIKAKKE